MAVPVIAITCGEPAGIGPEIIAKLTTHNQRVAIVYIGDVDLLQQRAKAIGISIDLQPYQTNTVTSSSRGQMYCIHQPVNGTVTPGKLDTANASYVTDCLLCAHQGAIAGHFDAIVTAPAHKAVIIASGINFSGHTEYFARLSRVEQVLMLLVHNKLRVALLTTHIPLKDVPTAITSERLRVAITILQTGLQQLFQIKQPKIAVLGLNPHAGEDGKIGTEEQTTILPVIKQLQQSGMDLYGPLAADTALIDAADKYHAILAMYHDQGLPTIKAQGFGQSVNVTLGLPYIRTSVDHGTAIQLAGTSQPNEQSLIAAVSLAEHLINKKRQN